MSENKQNENRFTFDKRLSVRDVISIIGIGVMLAFWYFTTQANTKAIEELKRTKVSKEVYETEIRQFHDDIREIKRDIKTLLRERK